MTKRRIFMWMMALVLLLPMALAACGGGSLEEQIEQAAQTASDTAEQVAENAGEIAQQAEEAAAEAVDAAQEAAEAVQESAEAMVEEATDAASDAADAAEEMVEEVMEPTYDTAVYGNMDEIDLSGVEVTFWHQHSGGRGEELDAIVADFNASNEYGITVIASNEGGYDDIYDKMITGLTTGEVPSLVVAYQNQAAAYQVAEGLVSLEPYITHPTYGLDEGDRADFFAAFIDSDRLPQFGGEAFGFPPNRSMELIYYNADWLAELGYDGPPTTPEEWGEMMCAAAQNPFSKNPNPEFSLGLEVPTDASALASWVLARGGNIYDYAGNQFAYNSPEAVAALTQFQELFNQGCVGPIAERFGDQTDFGNGAVLFTQGSSSGLPFYVSTVNDGATGGFAWSVAAIPHTTPEPVQNIYGASVSVPRTTPEEQLAAWVFLKYYTSPDIQARWARASNYFPVRASVADGLGEYFEQNPAYQVAFDLLKYGTTEPPVAGYDNVRDEASQAVNRVVFDGEDAATVLAELDAKANALLEEAAP